MTIFVAEKRICDKLNEEREKKMKAKMKIKFDLNETIKRLEAITAGFQASAQRLDNIVAEAQAKKDEAHQKYMGETITK